MPAYSGLYDGVYGQPHSLLSDDVASGNVQTEIGHAIGRRSYGRGRFRGLMLALLGAAAGQNAVVQHSRRKAVQNLSENAQGGLVDIETFDDVNRATTSDDLTSMEAAVHMSSQPSSYVADASGNGGGGKLGR